MRTCSACGTEVATSDAFCQVCGTALQAAGPTVAMMPPIAPALAEPSDLGEGGDGHYGAAPEAFAGVGAAGAADQLVGRSQPNQTYLGTRLVYEPKEVESFDPLGSAFVKEMAAQAFIVGFAGFALGFVPFLFFLVGLFNGSGGLRVIGGIGLFIAGPVLWLYFWFHRLPVAKSEWKLLVDDQAGVAEQVFSHITWALKRRQTPMDRLRIRRLSLPRKPSRDYLEIRDGIFTGFISAFSYGEDLYIGWTMWWNLSPFRWVIVFLGRLYLALTGRGSQIHVMHRYEQAKALREAMHSAAREGVDAAAGFVAYEGAGTIGSDIQVEVVASMDNVPGFVAASTE